MQNVWWRRALEQRLGTLTAAALLLWTIGTAAAAAVATDRMAGAILVERQAQARGIARRIDHVLDDALQQLDLVAAASAVPRRTDDLAAYVRGLRLAESVVRIGPGGELLWARSVVNGGDTTPPLAALPRTADGRWHAEPTALIGTSLGARVFLVLPARDSDPVGGAVAAAIDPRTSALQGLLVSYAGDPYRVELLDEHGSEIAASRAAVRSGPPADSDLLVARAPIANGRWSVRLVQPRDDALAPVLVLRSILVGSSLLLLPFAVLAAVAAARSIREPVLTMTAAAEALARGDYARAIPPAGADEIGRLAAALEQLRRTLEQDELRSLLLKRIISAQEEERRRIARELHDQTAQQLTALSMQIESASAARPDVAMALTGTQGLVRAAIDDLHRVIHDLRPALLDDLGLLPAIGAYAQAHLAPLGIDVHCEFPEALPDLSREATIALYRVVQEALTNVARHAGAQAVLLACTVSDDQIGFDIEDDGSGFEPSLMERPRATGEGLGLLGMRERIALLGGRVEIDSEPGRGTRVVALLPLAANLETRGA